MFCRVFHYIFYRSGFLFVSEEKQILCMFGQVCYDGTVLRMEGRVFSEVYFWTPNDELWSHFPYCMSVANMFVSTNNCCTLNNKLYECKLAN